MSTNAIHRRGVFAVTGAALSLAGLALTAGCATDPSGLSAARDDSGVREVIEGRRLAWNAQDVSGYGRLLAADAELTSATGKTAYGRDEILRLYVEQRQGVYRDASLPSTVVERIKFITDDVAVAEATFVLAGVRSADGATLAPVEGTNSYLLVRQSGRWLISSMRGVPRKSFTQ
ncbi:SgcJ/EcaC family oxidoreductase [Xylophilus sp. GOD-11R]|uniref:YybH family protein n=1 Tax=Xylophilus sp. GOD-11R TaxID=3089814 RepID=UPI00298CC71B|nr:SgcJ/EcaC family oxidoreductase [Xylophilus sp. GOD-11R]WPB58391.1 SgcJ/EcaC family oxidoreductase [Xylophilus sp. GOD-11R]